MKIERFDKSDHGRFLELAAIEKWVADPWELDFLLEVFPAGCVCAKNSVGKAVGFATAMSHNCSGWIGNLIVDPDYRSKGVGESLFLSVMNALLAEGAETIWLTASNSGKPLYEKHGFRSVDKINRWIGKGRADLCTIVGDGLTSINTSLDRLGWGDDRYQLLHAVTRRGFVQSEINAFATLQPYGDSLQLGPWAANEYESAGRMLDQAMATVPAGISVYCDTPAGNRSAACLLELYGFAHLGSSELMCAGSVPEYRPEYVFGLATMGSCG